MLQATEHFAPEHRMEYHLSNSSVMAVACILHYIADCSGFALPLIFLGGGREKKIYSSVWGDSAGPDEP